MKFAKVFLNLVSLLNENRGSDQGQRPWGLAREDLALSRGTPDFRSQPGNQSRSSLGPQLRPNRRNL